MIVPNWDKIKITLKMFYVWCFSRLYQEMKKLQKQAKATEEKMFKENQKLTSEIANLRYNVHNMVDHISHFSTLP